MTTATMSGTPARAQRPGFGNLLASEWTKLMSVRSTYIEFLLSIGLALLMTAAVSLAIGTSYSDLTESERATFDPVEIGSFGAVFAVTVLVVLGVTFASSEYTSGMIRLTFATTPRRLRVFIAKCLLVLLFSLAVGVIVAFGSFFIGQAVLSSYEEVPTASISDGNALELTLAVWATIPVYPLLGTAAAVILRSTASALTAILALLFVPGIFGGLLPEFLQRNVLRYLPNFAIDNLTTNNDASSATYLSTGAAILVVLAWLAGFGVAAYLALTRRDV